MPSFDVVSEINWVELHNACDQANKEISTRFDFKGSDARIELNQKDKNLTLFADDDFKLKQVNDILIAKMAKRNVDVRSIKAKDKETISGNKVKQVITVLEGLETDFAKKIVKMVKDSTHKNQASIQGNSVRISGSKKDALQDTISLLREKVTDIPLQFINFRD